MSIASSARTNAVYEQPSAIDAPAAASTGWGLWVLVVLLIPTVIIEVRNSLTRPFWFDELCTVAIAQLGKPAAIWDALAHGVDTQPPFFYVVTALSSHVVPDMHLAYRLPGLIGFLCVPFSLYLFVSRRVGAGGGLVAALVTVVGGFNAYASEARPYGLEVGCLALALLFWQRLEISKWYAPAFTIALGAAVALHFYAVISVSAFVFGESVRWHRTRRFRASAWVSVIVAGIPFLISAPLMVAIRHLYGAHFWARDRLHSLPIAYENLAALGPIFTPGVVAVLVLLAAAAMAVPVTVAKSGLLLDRVLRRLRSEEWAAAVVLLCLPLLTCVVLSITQGGLIMRYVLPTVLGLGIVAGFSSAALGRNVTTIALVVLVSSYGYSSLMKGLMVFHGRTPNVTENSLAPLLERMIQGTDPAMRVVISSGTDYLPLAYYSSPELRKRMLTVVDPEGAIQAINSDSVDREELLLAPYLPVDVEEFAAFRQTHRRFMLFSSGNSFDWWPGRLLRDGQTLTLRKLEGPYRLYEVELVH